MPQKSRSTLKQQLDQKISSNQAQQVTAQDINDAITDVIDSAYNKADDNPDLSGLGVANDAITYMDANLNTIVND